MKGFKGFEGIDNLKKNEVENIVMDYYMVQSVDEKDDPFLNW